MDITTATSEARRLLSDGLPDEDVERLTGLDLTDIIGLRAEAASAPFLSFQLPSPTRPQVTDRLRWQGTT